MKLLVLGSQGFLGRWTVREALAAGHQVRVFAADPAARAEDLAGASVERVQGDPESRRSVADAARGFDAIVATEPLPRHLPPRVAPMVEASLLAAREVLAGAADAGPVKLVRVGSALAVGSTVEKTGLCTAADWTLGKTDARVRAHVETELFLQREAVARGVPLVRVLPTRLLGPGSPDPARDLKLVRAYLRFRLGLFAHGGLNVLDVRDAARAVIVAAERGEAGARLVVGGHNLTYKALYRAIAETRGRHHLHLAVPRAVAMGAFGLVETLFFISGRTAPLDRNFVDLHFGRYAFYDMAPAHLAFGLAPRPVEETMRDSVASLAQAHLL